jgi:hypothetical protein
MPSNRRRGCRRIAAIATAVAAVTLTAGLLTGCEDLDSSLDCLGNADSISDSVKAIHEAGWDAVKDPSKTDDSIDTIDKNLDKAIDDYNKSILNGDTTPDSSKIDAAADRLRDVCTS